MGGGGLKQRNTSMVGQEGWGGLKHRNTSMVGQE